MPVVSLRVVHPPLGGQSCTQAVLALQSILVVRGYMDGEDLRRLYLIDSLHRFPDKVVHDLINLGVLSVQPSYLDVHSFSGFQTYDLLHDVRL